jgi:hypothetical protein
MKRLRSDRPKYAAIADRQRTRRSSARHIFNTLLGLRRMQALLDSKGMLKVADDCRIKSLGLKGPLEDGSIEKVIAFAERIAKP